MTQKDEPTIKEALDKAVTAIKGGDLETGKAGLGWVLKREPNNVLAWLWMSRCVESTEKKLECFNRVLAIDPTNRHALEGVQRFGGGGKIQEPRAHQPASSAAPSTQASAEQPGSVESKEKPKRRRWLMIIGGGLFLMCMCSFVAVALAPDSDESTEVASVSEDTQAEPAGEEQPPPPELPLATAIPAPTHTSRPSVSCDPADSSVISWLASADPIVGLSLNSVRKLETDDTPIELQGWRDNVGPQLEQMEASLGEPPDCLWEAEIPIRSVALTTQHIFGDGAESAKKEIVASAAAYFDVIDAKGLESILSPELLAYFDLP